MIDVNCANDSLIAIRHDNMTSTITAILLTFAKANKWLKTEMLANNSICLGIYKRSAPRSHDALWLVVVAIQKVRSHQL